MWKCIFIEKATYENDLKNGKEVTKGLEDKIKLYTNETNSDLRGININQYNPNNNIFQYNLPGDEQMEINTLRSKLAQSQDENARWKNINNECYINFVSPS